MQCSTSFMECYSGVVCFRTGKHQHKRADSIDREDFETQRALEAEKRRKSREKWISEQSDDGGE